MKPVGVTDVFGAAGLTPRGPVRWGEAVPERLPGVYVVALVASADAPCPRREHEEWCSNPLTFERWQVGQPVIYIGRTRRPLRKRVREFYRHKYGDKRPHCGGQEVLRVECPLWVYWAATEEPASAEHKMIEQYKAVARTFPYANKVRSARERGIVKRKP